MGRPSALLDVEIDAGSEPVKVFDVNGRVGGDTYWWLLKKSSPAKVLSAQQSVLLFKSFGAPTDDAWRLLDANVESLKQRIPDCVSLMEKHGIFTPNFGWRFAAFPKVGVFLGAETLPDEFWWRLDRSGGTYWVIGDPFACLHQQLGYTRLVGGRNLLKVPETVLPLVQHVAIGATAEPGGPKLYQGSLDELRGYFEEQGHRLTVVTFKNKELAALPDWVERPLFQGCTDPTFLKTMMDRYYTGANGLWERILSQLYTGWETGELLAPATTSVDLKTLTPETPMADIYEDERVAALTVGEFVQKPWRFRYSEGAKCVARSVFTLTSAHNIAYSPHGPWGSGQEYATIMAAQHTLTQLKG